jgi:hypothetical protein
MAKSLTVIRSLSFSSLKSYNRRSHLTSVHGLVITQAISGRLSNAEARNQSQGNTSWVFVGHSDTGAEFSPSTSVFPYQLSFHQCSQLSPFEAAVPKNSLTPLLQRQQKYMFQKGGNPHTRKQENVTLEFVHPNNSMYL